jgi:hypothetical protein
MASGISTLALPENPGAFRHCTRSCTNVTAINGKPPEANVVFINDCQPNDDDVPGVAPGCEYLALDHVDWPRTQEVNNRKRGSIGVGTGDFTG